MLCCIADSGHNCRRSSQNKGTRAEYNKDGDRTDNFFCYKPRKSSGSQSNHNDPSGPFICNSYNFRFPCVSRLNKPYHSLDRTILTNLCRFHFKCSELIDSTAGNLVPDSFVNRHGLTRHNRLIDRSLSRQNHAVYGNAFSGQNTQDVANLYLFSRNNKFLFIS